MIFKEMKLCKVLSGGALQGRAEAQECQLGQLASGLAELATNGRNFSGESNAAEEILSCSAGGWRKICKKTGGKIWILLYQQIAI